jgi:hypothetical protein
LFLRRRAATDERPGEGLVGFLVARPLIAILIAAAVVGVLLLTQTHRPYMARAGYNPRQAVAFWERMLRASKGKEPPEFASDQPSDKHRVERIKGWLPEAEQAYRPAKGS